MNSSQHGITGFVLHFVSVIPNFLDLYNTERERAIDICYMS